ncbi:TauD/TfdA family dioxygenase [Candidimonas sp. SYP-B2681]|uniref:TauD/TfdA family dioxygenase n=1 Tax=Candidimonas sp. SYP-B2681 TaxID=2497686 RepID=UPI001F211767|nr:TauD/TfdA family dioxygenase [Candidimonas sp. SYP-B2681]
MKKGVFRGAARLACVRRTAHLLARYVDTAALCGLREHLNIVLELLRHLEPGEVTCYLPTGYARLAEKSGQVPFTPEESQALYQVRKVAASPELYLDMGFREGDIQFLNNRMMVHGRTDYQDAPKLEDRRHLLRLWIEVPSWPAMPPAQIFHTKEDRALWSQYRQPLNELPSIHYKKLLEGSLAQMVD